MSCCAGCSAVEEEFNAALAERDLKRFIRRGPDPSTRHLLSAIREVPSPAAATLLDIGGGIGVIHHVLLDQGFTRAAHVDGSSAYLAVARSEAARRGHSARVAFHHGDFHSLAPQLPAADLVTLDRVVCCDPDGIGLLRAAADHAKQSLVFSYPKDRWYSRVVVALENVSYRLRRRSFRAYIHSPAAMTAVIERAGLRRRWSGGTWIWSVELFERAS